MDVQPLGQNGTDIGFAALNVWFHQLTGAHMGLYTITDWLGLVPIVICLCFGALGLMQLIQRKSLAKVDPDILLLGGYYLLVILAYLILKRSPSIIGRSSSTERWRAPIPPPRRCWC